MSSTQFSVRLPDDQKDFLDTLADATDRTRNQLISSAVGKMKENYEFVLAKIEAGDEDFAKGRTVSMSEAERRTQLVIDRVRTKSAS